MVWGYRQWGGAQIFLLSIIRNAPPEWRFTVMMPRSSGSDIVHFFDRENVDLKFLDRSFDYDPASGVVAKLKRQIARISMEFLIFRKLIRYARESVIHIEAAPWQSWILLRGLLALGRKIVVTAHNALTPSISNWRQWVWSFRLRSLVAHQRFRLTAANQDTIDSFEPFIGKILSSRIKLTRATFNKVDIDNALRHPRERDEILSKHSIPLDDRMVLCVGQFIDRKGRWDYLEAAVEVLRTEKNVTFVWVGPEPPNDAEIAAIKNYGLGNKFRFIVSADIGKERADVLNFFLAADLFVLPSHWEGLPITILEAMALGVPVVSTNINAIPEAIKNGVTGSLVEPRSPNTLAEKICDLLGNDVEREHLAAAGQHYVRAEFDEKTASALMIEIYSKLAESDQNTI